MFQTSRVEVVFAHHLGAVGLEHAGHGIADGSPTGAADVNRTGGVGGDELEIQGLAAQMVVAAVFVDLVEMLVGVGSYSAIHSYNLQKYTFSSRIHSFSAKERVFSSSTAFTFFLNLPIHRLFR